MKRAELEAIEKAIVTGIKTALERTLERPFPSPRPGELPDYGTAIFHAQNQISNAVRSALQGIKVYD